MLGALLDLLDWRYQISRIFCQLIETDYLVRGKFFPFDVWLLTGVAEKPTGSAEAGGLTLFTFDTLGIGWSADFLEDVLDVEEVVNEEGSLQAGDSILRQGGGLATVGAFHHLSLWCLACHWLQALLTEDMEAVKQFGVRVLL